MRHAAIYVRDPLTKAGNIISKEDQETACRAYCLAKDLTVSATFTDEAGDSDQFDTMIAQATGPDAPFDAIVVWKLHRFSTSLEETIEYRDILRRPAPSCSRPESEASTTSRFPELRPRLHIPRSPQPWSDSPGRGGWKQPCLQPWL